jgi:hypothetical protein
MLRSPIRARDVRGVSAVTGLSAVLLAGLCLSACDLFPTGLGRYRDSVLVAGRGLDDIALGSPLHAFVKRFGTGRVTTAAADPGYATDLSFREHGMVFRFTLGGPCLAALSAAGRVEDVVAGLAKPDRFFKAFPACGLAPLHSIAVQGHVFRGGTDRGVRLGSATSEVLRRYGTIVALTAPPAAGDAQVTDSLDQASYASGIAFFVGDTGLAPPPGSDRTIRLWRATGDWTVRRIVIFEPGSVPAE